MADEILVDLNDVFEMAQDVGSNLSDDEQAPVLQVLATIALCERLDRMNRHLGFIGDTIHESVAWYQAVSPSR
jgi:hypothetical protein